MADYLVTGVAGFIGSAVAGVLIGNGDRVTGMDNLSTGFVRNIPQGVEFIEGDCRNKDVYRERLAGRRFDAILHIAGQNSEPFSFEQPEEDLRVNAESTLQLLRFAASVKCRRFIYASTMAVYGHQPAHAVDENEPLAPGSCYGVSKLAGEHYVRLYADKLRMSPTVLRLCNVYGPGKNLRNMRQGVISVLMAMMLRDGHIYVQSSPKRFRDFVYIDDVAAAFLACVTQKEAEGRTFNIGGDSKTSIGDLVDKLCALSDSPVTVEYAGSASDQGCDVHADISLACKLIGFDPEMTLDEGLARMYRWCTRHIADEAAGNLPAGDNPVVP